MKICMILVIVIVLNQVSHAQFDTNEACPDGIISYWKFDEAGEVNKFIDSYGGHNAFCADTNRPVEDTGIVENARRFDGDDEVNVPDNNVYDWSNNTSFTIEVWVKTTQPGTGNKVFIGKYQGGSQMAWWLGYGDSNKAIFSVRDSGGISSEVKGLNAINDGEWHHIVGVRNDSADLMQIFVDGVEKNRITTFFTGDFSGTSPINIGYFINDYHYSGLLDEAALYDAALSKEQILDHYNNGLQHKPYCDQFTDVESGRNILDKFFLAQNYPNPFNPSTVISWQLPVRSHVSLKVYDILGNEVTILVDEEKPAGSYSVKFKSESLSSGIYFYQLRAGNYVQTKKMVIIR